MGTKLSRTKKKKTSNKQNAVGMQADYNEHSGLQASAFHLVQDTLRANNQCFRNLEISETLSMAEFGCATGGNSKMYIDCIRTEVSKATGEHFPSVDVIFCDQKSNPWDQFQIDERGINFEFAKGSMYSMQLKKNYDVGFSNWALHWTHITNDERPKMRDAIWIQESENEALKQIISDRSNKELSEFLDLRYEEVNDGGVLVLLIQTSASESQIYMNQAKKRMVAEEILHERKAYLTEKLVVPEYYHSVEEIRNILNKKEQKWELLTLQEHYIECPFGDDIDEAIACYNSFCNFQVEQEDLLHFWETVKQCGPISAATLATILILKKKGF